MLGLGLGLTAVRRAGGGGGGAALFAASAQKIVDASAAKRTVVLASSPPTVDLTNTGASTINGRLLNQNGATATASVPDGKSGPGGPPGTQNWIMTKAPGFAYDPATQTGRTYAPGNSKRFIYNGQKFDFKVGISSSKTLSIWYSEDVAGGYKIWKKVQDDSYLTTQQSWCLVDFGSAASRAIEIIGEDEGMQLFGFNFEAGTTISAMADTMAVGMMLGDSYVFGQGASQYSVTRNGQQATKGMVRKVAEYLGTLNAYNNGYRTNGFANNQGGVQAYFHERIDMAVTGFAEGTHWGTLDWVIMPASINDDGKNVTLVQDNTTLAFQKLRAAQPTALILFTLGAQPPTGDLNGGANNVRPDNSATHNARRAGFKAVFGNTSAEWIANGAYMIDGTEAGENWVPSGLIGTSAYFPGGTTNADGALPDYAHPNVAGHDFFASKYAAGLLTLATAIVATGGATANLRTTTTGDQRVTTSGETRKAA